MILQSSKRKSARKNLTLSKWWLITNFLEVKLMMKALIIPDLVTFVCWMVGCFQLKEMTWCATRKTYVVHRIYFLDQNLNHGRNENVLMEQERLVLTCLRGCLGKLITFGTINGRTLPFVILKRYRNHHFSSTKKKKETSTLKVCQQFNITIYATPINLSSRKPV